MASPVDYEPKDGHTQLGHFTLFARTSHPGRLAPREDAPPQLGTAIYVNWRYCGLFEGAREALRKSATMGFDQAAS